MIDDKIKKQILQNYLNSSLGHSGPTGPNGTSATDPGTMIRRSGMMYGGSKEIKNLDDQPNDIKLFISKQLFIRLEHIRDKIEFDGNRLGYGNGRIMLKKGTSYEVDYVIEIDDAYNIEFTILVNHDGSTLIDLVKSNKIFAVDDIRTVNIDDIVLKFIPEADVLQVLDA